ncbi:SurA N-terminal domain-containing protein [Solimicrobium silvestre]|uniref:Periplasmic chaperone PpiD n=1 Tax=Solimicrobium silvestre TaxID=2099400 RepID=A0A2S9GTX2_9BURK|nr:SurA N-terminal domain-containing protein [Solimicrobium silvestre]PRC91185.1 PPIC-type PPIASE domain [Solimicrobium silvestre]
MFEYVRTHQRLMQFILLLFIVPSFALVGISSYVRGNNEETVAKVAGENISQQEFDDALRQQMDKMRQRFGDKFDEAMFNTVEAKKSILDNLIAQRVLRAEVKNQNLSIPDQVLQQNILAIPGLTLPNGSFDNEGYKNALAAQRLTPTMYESGERERLAQQQLTTAIEGSAFVPKAVLAQVNAITSQEREIQSIDFKAADFVSQVKITDAMLKAYYDKNGAQFQIPEMAKIEYVVLSGETIAAQMTASDEEIKAYYDQNIKNYSVDEQRRASHILIKVNKGASAAEKAAAKAKAEEVLALVRKQPENFAQLAKQYSEDEGSKAQGGDLDFFAKGMMLKPFEDATYKLKENEISDLVESDFGFHIIHLTAIKPTSVKPLDQVKDQISADIKKQKAGKKFSEMAETFTNTVYEQSTSLQPVADKLKLTIATADNLTRVPNSVNHSNPILANPKFLKALFSDDAIKNKRNTEALELGANTLVSARIVEHKPASKRPFDEVKDVITARVTLAESESLAQKAGQAKLASLIATPDAAGFGDTKLVSRIQQGGIPGAAFDLIMKADTRKLPAFVGVELPGQAYAVYRINKIQQAAPDEGRTAEIAKQVDNVTASDEFFAYVEMLKQKGNVKIVKPFVATPAELAGAKAAS